MKEEENYRIVRAAGVVGIATFGSRILGFVRDMVTAFFFGTADVADAFFIAFTIPNLLRRLFAEGTLTVSFVPVFTDYLTNSGIEEAKKVFQITMTALGIILIGTVLFGIVFSEEIVSVIAPGFKDSPEKWETTIYLTRVMFPYIFFISLTALAMGVLNSLRHFFAPASAPMLLNIAMIAAMFLVSPYLDKPILGLAIGVIIGGVLQLLFQIPFLLKRGMVPKLNFNFSHPAVKTILRLMLPAIFGASIYQINVVVIRLLASFLPTGSVSYLYYADRLEQFPLGIFAVALGTAVLPSMSQMAAQNRIDELKKTFVDSLSLALYVAIPAAVGLIVLRYPIISLLFYRGEFDHVSVVFTSQALLFFSLGLPAVSAVRVMANAFYAQKDTATPVFLGSFSVVVNILLSLALMGPMGHNGLALAVSIAAFVNFLSLLVVFRRRVGRLGLKRLVFSVMRMCAGSIAMGLSAWFFASLATWDVKGQITEKIFYMTAAIVIGAVTFALVTRLLGSTELRAITTPFMGRFKGGKDR